MDNLATRRPLVSSVTCSRTEFTGTFSRDRANLDYEQPTEATESERKRAPHPNGIRAKKERWRHIGGPIFRRLPVGTFANFQWNRHLNFALRNYYVEWYLPPASGLNEG